MNYSYGKRNETKKSQPIIQDKEKRKTFQNIRQTIPQKYELT